MKNRERSDVYCSDIDRKITEENGPACPYDINGPPCSTPERGCYAETFGILGDETLWTCPRYLKSR